MTNALRKETSPYLLQHADNPVHWRAWGPEAFAEARERNRPILLSVGYAACHWCHVMAHESFEDPATAELMNELFVPIKVDREERPDVDGIYQTALALLGQPGGWPLTMFLTPAGEPFWGGTYFPPDAKFGRPAFSEVLRKVDEVWRENADMVAKNVKVMAEALDRTAAAAAGDLIAPDIGDRLAEHLIKQFDPVHGGIAGAPKFPHVPILDLVLRSYRRTGEPQRGMAVRTTLRQMCQGGIYDHLGGGFARYTTDALWLVPHFEKMLYDNAQMIEILHAAHGAFGDALFAERLAETVGWLGREMIAEGGAFAATLDADSEGEEGRFYVWTAEEVDEVLGEDAEPFKEAYGVHPSGNWEGKTILNRLGQPGRLDDDAEARLAEAREKLLARREGRVRPGRDDKVLADWNGLAIAALARAGAAFGHDDWLAMAERAFAFVAEHMTDGEGRLAHATRAGKATPMATLDDYAAMARAALALYEVRGGADYLERARDWAAVLEAHYLDADGGFFFTADDADDLILRTKAADDGPTPSGNGMMVEVYARLWLLTGEARFRERAEAVIRAFSGGLEKGALSLATLINAAELLDRGLQVAVIGAEGDDEAEALRRAAFAAGRPNLVFQRLEPGAAPPEGHPAAGKTQKDGRATAYVCVGATCSLPLTDAEALAEALAKA